MSLFSGKIYCSYCDSRMKPKKARQKQIYCCSLYERKGKAFCRRNKVDEEFILMLMEMRLRENYNVENVKEVVTGVYVKEDEVVIKMVNDDDIVAGSEYARF